MQAKAEVFLVRNIQLTISSTEEAGFLLSALRVQAASFRQHNRNIEANTVDDMINNLIGALADGANHVVSKRSKQER